MHFCLVSFIEEYNRHRELAELKKQPGASPKIMMYGAED